MWYTQDGQICNFYEVSHMRKITIRKEEFSKLKEDLKKKYDMSDYMAGVLAKALLLHQQITNEKPSDVLKRAENADTYIEFGGFAILKKEIHYDGPFTRGILYIEVDLKNGTFRLLEEHEKPRAKKVTKAMRERQKEFLHKILEEELKKLKKRKEVIE